MKAVILAAGMGRRLAKYTRQSPKGMLKFRDKPLLGWQIELYRRHWINDISIVTGYMREKIQFAGIQYYNNQNFANTNMIESLMCLGDDLFSDDTIISYSDILFSDQVFERVLSIDDADIIVSADSNWRNYWLMRYGTTEADLESFKTNSQGEILEIGMPLTHSENLPYRYIGLNKFSKIALVEGRSLFLKKKALLEHWQPSLKEFDQGYFTDFIHELIQSGVCAKVALNHGGWLEFDTDQDYEKVSQLDEANSLVDYITI